jgi:hypothetical protein
VVNASEAGLVNLLGDVTSAAAHQPGATAEMSCRGCGSDDVTRVLDLGLQPGSDHFPPASVPQPDERRPLELWLCPRCTLVQLGPVTPRQPEPPLAVESATSREHARASVRQILERMGALSRLSVVEFASHHGGSWLDHLTAAGARLASGTERADLVVDVHALAHEREVGRALRVRAGRLAPQGLLVLEFHHLLPLLRGSQFDTVRHGHWSYLSLGAIQLLAGEYGLRVVSAQAVPVFGGSLRVLLCHRGAGWVTDGSVPALLGEETDAGLGRRESLARLQEATVRAADLLHTYLTRLQASGRTVLGYGAPSKAPVLLGVAGVGPDLLPFTVDLAPGKQGRRIPGCGIPIRPVEALRAAGPDVVLLLTWDIADEVIDQLETAGGWGAQYVVPLPEPTRCFNNGLRSALEMG